MASELTTRMGMLPLDGPARAWEPKRLRLRLVRGGRRLRLRLAATWPWPLDSCVTVATTWPAWRRLMPWRAASWRALIGDPAATDAR